MASTPATPDDGTGDQTPADLGMAADLEPPNLKTGYFGVFSYIYRAWRHRRNLRRKASKGYVQWYLVDDGWPEPKYVKPSINDAGIPELVHDGERYLFPREAMVPHKRTGMWTIAHMKGEDGTPINLQRPDEFAIPPGLLQEWATMSPQTDEPGLFDRLDLDAGQVWTYLIIGIIAFALIYQFLGGGV